MRKVLVLVPPLESKGGVANYYAVLKDKFSSRIEYCVRGTRNQSNRKIWVEPIRFVRDIYEYRNKINTGNYELVHINTSLGPFSIVRDSIYIRLAHKRNIACIPFFRGWSIQAVHRVEKYLYRILKNTYLKCPAIITLSMESEKQIKALGFKGHIYRETTLVDENLLDGFEIGDRLRLLDEDRFNLLFMARLEFYKGIRELIDAFIEIRKKYIDISLFIAGTGGAMKYVEDMARRHSGITVLGHVSGNDKTVALTEASVFCLPSYAEGMPNCILEAKAFGLPVICTPVGGIKDIIKDGMNGMLVDAKNDDAIVKAIELLYLDRDLCRKMSCENYTESTMYYSRAVADRLERIYDEALRR
ncbi:MAG: glycosyltransferase family 4 protein [Clostridia bacterium]|nr:glycosyltransferase family 4 protein [Clostridia bacterium]